MRRVLASDATKRMAPNQTKTRSQSAAEDVVRHYSVQE